MKFKNILTAIAVFGLAVSASAQLGFDTYRPNRTVVLMNPAVLAASGTTNSVVDMTGFGGIGKVSISFCPNATGTVTAQLQSSTDTNTWAGVTYATSVSTSVTVTNGNIAAWGGTNGFTDTIFYPGTVTTPTASTAGYAAIPYVLPAPMTNTAALTLSTNWNEIGFNIADANRYLRLVIISTGSTTSNAIVGAVITASRVY